ncbi:NnrS family protein [Mesorhizobium sp. VNQ89]|uniref:NnrS family protein n=1 Tax=Mesorhizobium quangtriensis TaxID=3157709 RepID=UPI0032B7ACBB
MPSKIVSAQDRSVPRAALKSGDTRRDGRGRIQGMPPILHYGFRPFFFVAALYAGVAIPVWLCAYFGGFGFAGPFDGLRWHAHEMLFGYLGAVVAGFILTAIPNWTGRLPLSGGRLAVLVGLWLAGRIACIAIPSPTVAAVVDLSFPAMLAFAIWREVVAGRNWKNAPVAAIITLLGVANLLDHLANLELAPHDLGQRLALGVAAMLIALIGGRIIPSFTRNWLVKNGVQRLPAPFGAPDKAALAATALAMVGWLTFPGAAATGLVLCTAGFLLPVRLVRWRAGATVSEPILLILHVGYGWLALALTLLGLAMLVPDISDSAALHALTAGAIGTMTLAVMTLASLGHTGRAIKADGFMVVMYAMVTTGAALRVAAPFLDDGYSYLLSAGGALWSGAFLLFAIRFAPILWGRRVGVDS